MERPGGEAERFKSLEGFPDSNIPRRPGNFFPRRDMVTEMCEGERDFEIRGVVQGSMMEREEK